jgi:hypothetical protein
MPIRKGRYFAFARFCTTTREVILNPSFEITSKSQRNLLVIAPSRTLASPCRLWLRLGLADLRRRRFFFAPGEEPLDHIECYRDKKNRDC